MLCLLVAAACSAAPELEGPFPASADELCVVCYSTAGANGIPYLISGQRYAVHPAEQAQFISNPAAYSSAFEQRRQFQRLAWLAAGTAVVAAAVFLWRRRRASA